MRKLALLACLFLGSPLEAQQTNTTAVTEPQSEAQGELVDEWRLMVLPAE